MRFATIQDKLTGAVSFLADGYSKMFSMFCYMTVAFAHGVPTSYSNWKDTVSASFMASFGDLGNGGQALDDLPRYAVILGVIAIVSGLSVKILASMKVGESESTVNDTLDKGITSVDTLTDWLDDIALVIAAVIILAMIIGMLYLVSMRGQ